VTNDGLRSYVRRSTPATRRAYEKLSVLGDWSARRRCARAGAALAAEAAMRVDDTRGYLVMPPAGDPLVEQVVARTRRIFEQRGGDSDGLLSRVDYLRRLPLDDDDLSFDSPFLRFGLARPLLAAAASYLGTLPLFANVWVWHSPNDELGAESGRINTRRFHLDYEGSRQLKLFVFAEDVDEESGPMCLLDAATSERVVSETGYKLGTTLDDRTVEAYAPAGVTALCGAAGTVALVDTSRCLHFGSRPGTRARLVWGAQYLSPFSLPYGRGWPKGSLSQAVTEGLDPLVATVLGRSPPPR